MTLAIQVTQTLNWSVRQACELEAQLVSVERMVTYRDLPPEPGYAMQAKPPGSLDGGGVSAPTFWSGWTKAQHWTKWAAGGEAAPSADGSPPAPRGRLELTDVRLRYRDGLPLALDGLTVTVQPHEKVGVVGRTGSGKSSLFAALTRLVAPPLREGSITLDGAEIEELPLHEYRRDLCAAPAHLRRRACPTWLPRLAAHATPCLARLAGA